MIRLPHALLLVLPLLVPPRGTGAQELTLKREVPGVRWEGCAADAARGRPGADDDAREEEASAVRVESQKLAAAATQASILGDHASALELLERAVALDPGSGAVAYRLARTLEDLARTDEALEAYCRYLALSPDPQDAREAQARIAALARVEGFAVPVAAARAYEAGIAHYDAGRLREAEGAFDEASSAVPSWSDPVYNRAVVRVALGRTDAAAEDLRRFLQMSPGSTDSRTVADVLDRFRRPVARVYSPTAAFATGLLVPGLGHFTTGRPAAGALLLGAAAGAAAAGILIERVDVECLSPPVAGDCPPEHVYHSSSQRPYLIPGVAIAAAVVVAGAVDAFLGARRHNARATDPMRLGSLDIGSLVVAVAPPRVHRASGGARADLLRVRLQGR